MRISDWSSDVCSSDLSPHDGLAHLEQRLAAGPFGAAHQRDLLGAACTEPSDQAMLLFDILRALLPFLLPGHPRILGVRSEGRRVGKECVSTCRSRRSPYH